MGLIMRNRECYTGKVREPQWRLLYEFENTGYTEHAITLPICSEILIEVSCVVSSYGREFTQVIPYERISSSTKVFYLGGSYVSTGGLTYSSVATVYMSLSAVTLNSMYINGTSYHSTTTLRIYAR